jgi:hypothetical protein
MGPDAMLIDLVARRTVPVIALGLLMVLLGASRASAQFEFTGSWAPIGTETCRTIHCPSTTWAGAHRRRAARAPSRTTNRRSR